MAGATVFSRVGSRGALKIMTRKPESLGTIPRSLSENREPASVSILGHAPKLPFFKYGADL
jgi:hypothetical protein